MLKKKHGPRLADQGNPGIPARGPHSGADVTCWFNRHSPGSGLKLSGGSGGESGIGAEVAKGFSTNCLQGPGRDFGGLH